MNGGTVNGTKDSENPDGATKSKNALKNEEKKKAKQEKAAMKQQKGEEKKQQPASSAEPKAKPKKDGVSAAVEEFVNTTPRGAKKDLSAPMASSYNPKAVEAAWYSWWEESGYFKPQLTPEGDSRNEGTFVIAIPPPNVTGSLHLGHALTNSIQDTMTRWNRMKGKTVLWNPGCDHAGIATQVVVEKKLWKEQKKTRHDLGREEFLKEVWRWKDESGGRIYEQLRRLGGSFDWDRARFTMDPMLVKAVNEAFIRLHEEGIIYRENKLVNWCTSLKTALSNLEVENEEIDKRTMKSVPDHDPNRKYEFGVIAKFAYPLESGDGEIVVATTRLETMLGDTAVAVHPTDERYKHLHGSFVVHPLNGRKIPIIADEMVDPAFGTGAVKITPAHDYADYETGKRHNLPFINILNEDGSLNENGAPYTGQKRFDVRVAIEKELTARGLFRGKDPHKMMLPICDRSKNIVEPLMKPQWWVRSQPLAVPAMEAVRDGSLKIQPISSEKEWFAWLQNIQDWCISRQLWWGHRVPAYLVKVDGQSTAGETWVSAHSKEEALKKAMAKFPDILPSRLTLEQDPDVLDTWFSSGLWPFSIFGWPDKTEDMRLFYPTSLLETGWDILFFWVARMVMMGIKLTGQLPFNNVFCHAMVRDRDGRKMSKSLGNVVDPISVIEGISLEELHRTLLTGNLDPREVEKAKDNQKKTFPKGIPECGTDALRFTLCAYTSTGRDINLDIMRVEGYRKFCNKLWNAVKFALMKLGDDYTPPKYRVIAGSTLAEKWILSKLNTAVHSVNNNLDAMNFMSTTAAIYSFWLYEEVIKPILDGNDSDETTKKSVRDTLYTVTEEGLKLLHPFMPFITEELYQRLPRRPEDTIPSIMLTKFPEAVPRWSNPTAEKDFGVVNDVVHAVRSLMADYQVKTNAKIFILTGTREARDLMLSQTPAIQTLARGVSFIDVRDDENHPVGCALVTVSEAIHVLLLVKGVVNIDQELSKLRKEATQVAESKAKFERDLARVPDYETKVPANVREQNDAKLREFDAKLRALATAVETFERIRDEPEANSTLKTSVTSPNEFPDLPGPAGLKDLNTFLESRSYIEGWTPSQADARIFARVGESPSESHYPHVWRWYQHIASFGDAKSQFAAANGKTLVPTIGSSAPVAPQAAHEDEEEEIDLFGDDEVDEEAERIKAERVKEYEAKKAKKTVVIAKSSILLDVKPWDDETDMTTLEANVRSIEIDGLVWGQSKLVPVGYGIKKLQISCVVEDDKVGMDDLSDRIQADEDHVQSVDPADTPPESYDSVDAIDRHVRALQQELEEKLVHLEVDADGGIDWSQLVMDRTNRALDAVEARADNLNSKLDAILQSAEAEKQVMEQSKREEEERRKRESGAAPAEAPPVTPSSKLSEPLSQ
ncbi:hypothetical protein HDU93_002610 [Gonapodya sp. JEL0774]|nr:hypothetical protein HDU93_002610 [Gonapodya sp. JEL0774]